MSEHIAEINKLVNEFFHSFDNRHDRLPDFGQFERCFLDGAVVGVRTDAGVTTWSLQEFWEPRVELLSGGRLTDFHEWETEAETTVVHGLAVRHSTYQKDGLLEGEPYQGTGTKFFQLAFTPDGWRIVYVLWEDHS